jgi:VWFA-related protein
LVRLLTLTATACAFSAGSQSPNANIDNGNNPLSPAKTVIVNVTALDASGQPLIDLTAADFQIFDQGQPQRIASLKPIVAHPASGFSRPTTVILFDLLNSVPHIREYINTLLIHALEPLETGDSIYLYLLTNHGDLYPVRDLAGAADFGKNGGPAGTPWTRQIHPLMDRAIKKVYGFMPVDDRDIGIRAAATFRALAELEEQMTQAPGPKSIVWITAGVRNWLHYPLGCGRNVTFQRGSESYVAARCSTDCTTWRAGQCLDYTPFLRHFSAELDRASTAFYSVEETANGGLRAADRGTSTDTLQQLADLTGGRMYVGAEVEKAIAQSQRDARARYQLAYEAPAPDGKYHKLRLACARKDVAIEAQRGYFADQAR